MKKYRPSVHHIPAASKRLQKGVIVLFLILWSFFSGFTKAKYFFLGLSERRSYVPSLELFRMYSTVL
jgi:hypothetical protein